MTTMPILRLPDPLTPKSIEGLMNAQPYLDLNHPQSKVYRQLVQRGFEIMYPDTRFDAIGRMIDDKPRPPERIAHLVAKENREMEEMERGFDERPSGGGEVHVQSHAREGGKVEVADYWRAAPGEGSGSESMPESPKARNLLDDAENAGDETDAEDAQAGTDSSKPWQDRSNPELREAIADFEQSANKPNDGYEEHHKGSNALGRYQMTPDALKDIEWRNRDGTWTKNAREHGVESDADFLANPKAQEEAMDRLLDRYEDEAKKEGLFNRVGQKIEGRVAGIEVTEAGIMAGVHVGGATGTERYFGKIDQAGGVSKDADLTIKERAIETRMRKAQGADYQRSGKQ